MSNRSPDRAGREGAAAHAAPVDGLASAAGAAFAAMPLGCVIIAPDLTIADWNPAATRILGFSRAEVVGRPPFGLFVPKALRDATRNFLAGMETDASVRSWTYVNRTRDGREVQCEWQNVALRGPDGRFIGTLGTFADVTLRERSQRRLEESEAKFRSLVEQSLAGMYMIDGERVAYVNQRGAEILGYAPEEAIGRRFIEAIDERDKDSVVAQFALRTAGVKSKAGYTVRAVRKDGAPVIIGITSALVSVDGAPAIIGILQDVTEHEQAKQRILDHARQLEDAMLGTIGAVTAMIEQRDPYTAGHERHVSALGEAIGRELGLSSAQCRGLQIAGTVHDIGKNAISVEILNKNTRLTDAEFALIKEHSQAGYDVLRDIEFPWPVAEAVLQHHERLDGSGYPRGLAAEQIIPEARIIAVADVVESMATHRPYRSALGLDKALEEITQFRGARYDADVVDACVPLFRDKEYRLDA